MRRNIAAPPASSLRHLSEPGVLRNAKYGGREVMNEQMDKEKEIVWFMLFYIIALFRSDRMCIVQYLRNLPSVGLDAGYANLDRVHHTFGAEKYRNIPKSRSLRRFKQHPPCLEDISLSTFVFP